MTRGDEFRIIGKAGDDEWWYVCCVDGNGLGLLLVFGHGQVDAVPVSDAIGGLAVAVPCRTHHAACGHAYIPARNRYARTGRRRAR